MFFKSTRMLKTARKFLNLHEYQAAEVLSHYQLPVLPGGHASTPTEAYEVAKQIKTPNLGYVLKAQIHSGGRGRGTFKQSGLQGGVQILDSPESVRDTARKMLNDVLVTKQSGSEGKPCNTVYVVEKMEIEQEIYLAIMLDRENACPLLIASAQGGMGIEELDKKYILQKQIDPRQGLTKQVISQTVEFLDLETEEQKETMKNILVGLYKCFEDKDCTLVEVNPLGITSDKQVRIFDCKVKVDDNANIRQHDLFKKEDLTQKDQKEVQASKYNLNYVKLDGNIGCLVNGAGLAMATMDLINYSNGKPANFLDIGGGSNAEAVKQAISIINDDEDVKSILINIFGGIVRCDIVVEGIINAVKDLKIEKPIVMRIKGNKSVEAKQMVEESGLNLYWFDDVKEACQKALSF